MKIIILGAGVIGVTSAYVLALRGHEVTIIERNDEPAKETSFANGGQLSYSHAEPWANPSIPGKLPKWIFREDSPLIFRPRADAQMFFWGMQFLFYCLRAPSRKNCIDMLRLGMYSKEKMTEIRKSTDIKFDFDNKGIIHIFSDEKEYEIAQRQAAFQHHYGCDETPISKEKVLELEPAFKNTDRKIIGGIHAHMDESGDPYLYCKALCDYMQKNMKVEILYNTSVTDLKTKGAAIGSVVTDKGEYTADQYVIAMAAYSPLLTKHVGVRLPIYPMKGYSLTVPAGENAPRMSITDGNYKVVYSRLGDRIRLAGTAEFAGYNTDVVESRIKPILRSARELFPQVDWETDRTEWACLRPSTPDGPPRIGKTKFPNLFLNTGHGTLGWTQCAGSAYVLADIMNGHIPAITSNGPMLSL